MHKQRLKNEAESYRNDIIPRARGEAEQMIQKAEGYKQEVVAKSKGEAERFISVYDSYKKSKSVKTTDIWISQALNTVHSYTFTQYVKWFFRGCRHVT